MIYHKSFVYFDKQILKILQSHFVSLGSDLFASSRLFLVIFFLFCFSLFLSGEYVFLSRLSIPWNVVETFAFQSDARVRVCICVSAGARVYVCAHQWLSLYVCQSAELRDKDCSLNFSAQMFDDISVCLLPKSKTVIFYTLFKGTQMKREEEMHFFFFISQRGSK